MTTITELHEILQTVFTSRANEEAKRTGFIQRERKVTGSGFAQTLVLGGLAEPEATRKQQHQHARQAGMKLSVQGLEQRFTESAVQFMRRMLEVGLEQVVRSEKPRTLLPAFKGVYITDCTRLAWEKGGMKIGVRWELQEGQIQASLSELQQHDQKTAVVERPLPVGALHLGDLGFFKLRRFENWNQQGVYWLSRFKVGTTLHSAAGKVLDLLTLLETATLPLVLPVRVGKKPQVSAYLLAARVSDETFVQRHIRLKEDARLAQRPLSQRQATLARWTLYLTNIPDLSFDQAHILARTRWQIELLFKLWKSHGQVLHSRSADPIRQQCEGYAKLLGVLVAHWLLLVQGWHHNALGLLDALRILRAHVPLLIRAFAHPFLWQPLFDWLQVDLLSAPLLSRRRKLPRAFQLWFAFDALAP